MVIRYYIIPWDSIWLLDRLKQTGGLCCLQVHRFVDDGEMFVYRRICELLPDLAGRAVAVKLW